MNSPSIDWYRVPLDAETLKGFTRKNNLEYPNYLYVPEFPPTAAPPRRA